MSVIHSDCLPAVERMQASTIDMVYLDPPFFTQKNHKQRSRVADEEYIFSDRWASIKDYITYMRERISQFHRVLKNTGSIFLHCDKNASHHLRLLLDEIFGAENFRNEIIWSYKRWTNAKAALQSQHQTIYFYSKTKHSKFNTLYTNYAASTNIDQILQARERDASGKSVYKTSADGKIVWGKAKKGVALGDVWEIPFLNPTAHERIGYPTQKPILLLERIIEISTDEQDVILDPFCGSGTTLVAAQLLKRKFIGVDIVDEACQIAKKRIANPIKTTSVLMNIGEDKYFTKTPMENSILASLEALPVQRNAGIDGFLRIHISGHPVPIKIQAQHESLDEAVEKLCHAAKKRGCRAMILVRTHGDGQTNLFMSKAYTENVFIIDSLELSVGNWFAGIEEFSRKIA